MFRQARLRLTFLYIGLFAVVIAVFSMVFYVGFVTVLAPAFDLAPELSTEQAAEVAYRTTVERIGLALIVADVIVIGVVGVAAWILAARTLRPIREAHARQLRFVADASHEIRTPLAAIRAVAEGALSGPHSPGELGEALVSVAGSSEQLTSITNDLLTLARGLEAVPVAPVAIDLSVAVAEAAETFAAGHPELRPVRLQLGPDIVVAADPADVARNRRQPRRQRVSLWSG